MGSPGQHVHRIESTLTRPHRVAMIDEDPTSRQLVRHWLQNSEYQVQEVASGSQLKALLEHPPAVVCLDLSFEEGRGLGLLKELRAGHPELLVIAMSSQRDAETAVAAMRSGAHDYLTKPLDANRVRVALDRAQEANGLRLSVSRLSDDLADRVLAGPLAGHTAATKELDALVARVITRDVAVCLQAERGSGEDQIAKVIHEGSTRCHGPLVELDCAALDPEEQEIALFGEQAGERTQSCGAFERASGGIVFLKQVGALSMRVQASLAQVLSEKAVRRVGGLDSTGVNVRVIAAHDEDLRRLVEDGRFREELFFRLVVYPVRVPPVRERRDDIPLVVSHYLRKLAPDSRAQMSPEAMEALMQYPWPGNLREVEHVVHRSLLRTEDQTIGILDLPEELREGRNSQSAPVSSRRGEGAEWMNFPENEVVPLRELEKRAIEHALRVTGGSVSVAAQKLGIGRATLYRRIASFDLSLNVA